MVNDSRDILINFNIFIYFQISIKSLLINKPYHFKRFSFEFAHAGRFTKITKWFHSFTSRTRCVHIRLVWQFYFDFNWTESFYISVKPSVITTSDGLRSYAPRVRGCYFNSERQLRFFKSYSQQKCQLECFSNYLKMTCGCVTFSLPSKWIPYRTRSLSFQI